MSHSLSLSLGAQYSNSSILSSAHFTQHTRSLCENLIYLESLIKSRTGILERLERVTYLIAEKDKVANASTTFSTVGKKIQNNFTACCGYNKQYYTNKQCILASELVDANELVTKEMKRRSRDSGTSKKLLPRAFSCVCYSIPLCIITSIHLIFCLSPLSRVSGTRKLGFGFFIWDRHW